MDKTTPANFIWEKRKPKKWRAGTQEEKDPAQEMIDACKRAAYIVWADSREEAERMDKMRSKGHWCRFDQSREEAERMDKMSFEELQAYVKERDGEKA